MNNVLFQAPSSFFDPTFWEELYKRKLHIYKLESAPISLLTFMKCSNGKNSESFEFSSSSYEDSDGVSTFSGKIINVNTVEEFRDCDKKTILEDLSRNILSAILNGEAVANPSLLTQFVLLTFADLKAYKFTYWMGVPALLPETPFMSTSIQLLVDEHSQLLSDLAMSLVRHRTNNQSLQSVFAVYHTVSSSENGLPFAPGELLSLAEALPHCFDERVYFVLPDMSGTAGNLSWTVRNFLALVGIVKSLSVSAGDGQLSDGGSKVNVIGLRGPHVRKLFSELKSGGTDAASSFTAEDLVSSDKSVFTSVQIDSAAYKTLLSNYDVCSDATHPLGYRSTVKPDRVDESGRPRFPIKTVGWESNERGKPGPRLADLSNTLDGRYLMAQAVDLNLSLMKWRMWPELDTQRLANTKCLLLGAGTLGCAVARSLLGWGVRNITLVDSGRVSYSNPARQCLFEFEDCVSKAFKAEAAAERLKKIFPDVIARGVVLSIPMPGHPMTAYSAEEVPESEPREEDKEYLELRALVESHDVVFALTDSREARWLPTAMCAASDKLLINAALGFDSYLVMRHGHGVPEPDSVAEESSADRLGCYFCNDILAATNSTRDRTLDQQCTVTRPGLSFIAAALSVEVMVAVLHSRDGVRHPAPSTMSGLAAAASEPSQEEDDDDSQQAVIPHQIRGSLTGFTQFLPQTPAFTACTACSAPIVAAYRQDGVRFVRAACEDSRILETVSGAAQLMSAVDLDDCVGSDDDF